MQNIQPTATGRAPERLKTELDISGRSGTPGRSEIVASGSGSPVSSAATTPTASSGKSSTKTSKGLDFPTLRLKASLLAGDVGSWLGVKGARAKSTTILLTQPNGKKYKAIRILLAVDEADIEVVETPDGIDFVVEGTRMKVVEAEK